MTHPGKSNDEALLCDLQRELRRLEAERDRAIMERDRLFAAVDASGDTGHSLHVALIDVKRIEQRVEQVRNLVAQKQQPGTERSPRDRQDCAG